MDSKLEDYYMHRFQMMGSQGWNDLLEDIRVMKESYESLSTINTLEELHFRKGQLDIIEWVLGLRAVSEATYEQLEAE